MSETVIGWSDDLYTGNTIIDTQHQFLFTLLDKMEKDATSDSVKLILTEIANYTTTHFCDEEALMSKEKFPDLVHHRILHASLIHEVTLLQEQASQHKLSNWVHVHRFLKEWLREHICNEDLTFSRFVQEK